MFEALGEEDEHTAEHGFDGACARGLEDLQGAAVFGPPVGVEVEDERRAAPTAAQERVPVALVARTGRMERELDFGVERAQVAVATQCLGHGVDDRPQVCGRAVGRVGGRALEPTRAVAAHGVGVQPLVTDRGVGEQRLEGVHVCGERAGVGGAQEVVAHDRAPVGERGDLVRREHERALALARVVALAAVVRRHRGTVSHAELAERTPCRMSSCAVTFDRPQRSFDPRVALAAASAFVLALLVKWPQRTFTHREPDEVVYWQLAQRLWQDGVYSLRGTRMLELLPASMYDQPLFHHPPLFAVLLGPFAANSAELYPPAAALWIVWVLQAIGAAACVVVAARLCRERCTTFTLACAVLVLACEPFTWFAARFLWIDTLSFTCAALAAAFGLGQRSRARLALAGLFAAFAGLAKLTGLVILPLLVVDLVRRAPPRGALAALLAPPLVLVGGWLALFAWHTGALLPTWIAPTQEILAQDALMREGFERSPLAYVWMAALEQPLLVWSAFAFALSERAARTRTAPFALWFVLAGAAIAATSLLGTTPVQTRQLAPLLVALYAVALVLLDERRTTASRTGVWRVLLWRATFVLAAGVGIANAITSVHGANVYELTPFWR